MSTATVRGAIRGMGHRANPAFAVGAVAVPVVALAYALTVAPVVHHIYVHVMAGVLWTGIDLFMALVLGPVLGFGVLLPGEVRIYRQLASGNPDPDVISRIGMRNARLSGLQGLFQLAIVVVMVYLRWPAA